VDLARAVCAHGTGVGADGLVVLGKAQAAPHAYHVTTINRSGLPAEMCGNAARCIARFAYDRGLAGQTHAFSVVAGTINAHIDAGSVTISLPAPSPLHLDMSVTVDGECHVLDVIDIGVPHAVLWWPSLDSAPVETLGAKLRHAAAFPKGTNVNFTARDGTQLRVRTFERGVEAETLACGTGAAAAAIAAVARGYLDPPVEVQTTQGGRLRIDMTFEADRPGDVRLSGPATYVFLGQLTDEWLAAVAATP
jgi:diaminopimelate epimerase